MPDKILAGYGFKVGTSLGRSTCRASSVATRAAGFEKSNRMRRQGRGQLRLPTATAPEVLADQIKIASEGRDTSDAGVDRYGRFPEC